jgi:hypothetical protein
MCAKHIGAASAFLAAGLLFVGAPAAAQFNPFGPPMGTGYTNFRNTIFVPNGGFYGNGMTPFGFAPYGGTGAFGVGGPYGSSLYGTANLLGPFGVSSAMNPYGLVAPFGTPNPFGTLTNVTPTNPFYSVAPDGTLVPMAGTTPANGAFMGSAPPFAAGGNVTMGPPILPFGANAHAPFGAGATAPFGAAATQIAPAAGFARVVGPMGTFQLGTPGSAVGAAQAQPASTVARPAPVFTVRRASGGGFTLRWASPPAAVSQVDIALLNANGRTIWQRGFTGAPMSVGLPGLSAARYYSVRVFYADGTSNVRVAPL